MGVEVIENKGGLDAICKSAGDKKIAIDFHAAWCGPCKIIGPKFVKMETEYKSIVFVKVDVDEADDVAEEYEITAMPTFIIIDKHGKKIDELVGANEDKLRQLMEKHK